LRPQPGTSWPAGGHASQARNLRRPPARLKELWPIPHGDVPPSYSSARQARRRLGVWWCWARTQDEVAAQDLADQMIRNAAKVVKGGTSPCGVGHGSFSLAGGRLRLRACEARPPLPLACYRLRLREGHTSVTPWNCWAEESNYRTNQKGTVKAGLWVCWASFERFTAPPSRARIRARRWRQRQAP